MSAVADHAVDVAIGLLLTGLFGLVAFAAKKWVEDVVTKATYPLQPHANGGLSLPDVARAARRTEEAVEAIADRQLDIYKMVGEVSGAVSAHLKNHR